MENQSIKYNFISEGDKKKYKERITRITTIICVMGIAIFTMVRPIRKYVLVNREKSNIKMFNNTSNVKVRSDSNMVKYNGVLYHVVPNDLLQEKDTYKKILDSYNMEHIAKKENRGECLSKVHKNSKLYKVKKSNTKDVLILYDNNKECTYVFSEKATK